MIGIPCCDTHTTGWALHDAPQLILWPSCTLDAHTPVSGQIVECHVRDVIGRKNLVNKGGVRPCRGKKKIGCDASESSSRTTSKNKTVKTNEK